MILPQVQVPLFFFFVCFRVASGFSPAAVGHPPFSGSSFASHSQSHSQRRSSSAKVRSDGSDKTTGEEGGSYAEALASAKSVLWRAAATKKEESDSVVAALLSLEQAARRRASEDPSSTEELTRRLDGSWRLCFTTGTIDQQKKSGRINYFPLKAIQSFDFEAGAIENGIYVGDAAVLKFSGPFDFDLKSRKLEFDFDTIRIFGFPISLGNKGAAAFGEKTGLGSKANQQLLDQGKRPFFLWIDADEHIATARGGGGGLALWAREEGEGKKT
eukprot:CAMPEP_0118893642 /NCGR_PEP_ID=MMETSP1166-20130328/2769_1 /TAXON_ID=1104430 /ORGANISM="Chrysoreinhardia sp, Strain CCMP3193" /LENGTH=271 /DNA_ID=CAMNT_0006832471 /DNA_START=18 /DNA_END=833 /DNA_ORIENTATION=-